MQATLKLFELFMANSLMMFGQALFTAIILAVYNTLLNENLRSKILKHAAAVNSENVIAVDATRYRAFLFATNIPDVVLAYVNNVDHVFYLGLTCAIAALLIVSAMSWVDIRKKTTNPSEKTQDAIATNDDVV